MVVGADLVLVDQVPVEVVQLPVALLHGPSAEEQQQSQSSEGSPEAFRAAPGSSWEERRLLTLTLLTCPP